VIDRGQLRLALIRRVYRLDDWVMDRYEKWPRRLREAYDERFDEQRVAQALCAVLGHEPETDQCLLPEHDHCAWCARLMPFQAANVPGRLLRRLHYRLDDPELSAKITEKLGEDGLYLRWRAHG
jgi:hypothetical protein